MSAFQIDLRDLEGGPVEKNFQPSREQLEELFAGLGDEVWLVNPEDFRADMRAQLTDGTVHVSGHVHGEFAYECGRCMSERHLPVDADVDFVLMSAQQWSNAYGDEDEIALSEDEMDVSYYEGEIIDLAELIREAALLEFPPFPQCPDELREQCDRLYEERVGDEALSELEEQKVDLRWTPLKNLKVTESGEVTKVGEDTKQD